MIDALEAVITYLAGDADLRALTDGRVDSRHQFGEGWPLPGKAVTVQWDGGAPDLYTPTQTPRLEVRCWGEDQYECGRLYRALVSLSRRAVRTTVETTDGHALIYFLVMASAPTFIRDLEIDSDALLVFMQASVAEQDVV